MIRQQGKIIKWIVCILGLSLVSGCSIIHKKSTLGAKNVLSIDAKQRLVIEGRDPVMNSRLYCAEPSPDALTAQAASLSNALDLQLPATPQAAAKTNTVKSSLAANITEAASSIGIRTQTIQLMRDGYYRLCEAMLNGQIGPDEYGSIVANIDGFILSMMAIEQLGGKIPVASNVAIMPSSSTSVKPDGTANAGSGTSSVTPASAIVLKNETEAGKVAAAQADAIVQALALYFEAKERTYEQRNDLARQREIRQALQP